MGLVDSIRSILGIRAESDAGRDADPDDLFGLSTAYMTMETSLGYESLDVGALCFSGVDSTDFRDAIADIESILEAGRRETGAEFSISEDGHGYQWVIVEANDPEDLLTSIHFAADTLIERGYGSRLLAGVFAYASDERTVYWIYSFRRGRFYPFVPTDDKSRNSRIEFKLESTLSGELDVESEKEYWYPLWPSRSGRHPWE